MEQPFHRRRATTWHALRRGDPLRRTERLRTGHVRDPGLRRGGDLAFAGAKLRVKVRWPERVRERRIVLALDGELSAVPARFEPNVWGSELRPIVDLSVGRFYAAVNPILATDLQGTLAGHPRLEPAAKLAIKLDDASSLGIEGYGAFGPIDDLGAERV